MAGSGSTDSETSSRFVEWMLSVVATWHLAESKRVLEFSTICCRARLDVHPHPRGLWSLAFLPALHILRIAPLGPIVQRVVDLQRPASICRTGVALSAIMGILVALLLPAMQAAPETGRWYVPWLDADDHAEQNPRLVSPLAGPGPRRQQSPAVTATNHTQFTSRRVCK